MTPSNTGTIFNIQYFSVHDGNGIRTVVFLKGCPLRCRWCANPESQKAEIEIAWQESKCIGCKQCQSCCELDAIRSDQGIKLDTNLCNKCLLCTESCPSQALYSIGEKRTVSEILDEIEQDEIFYRHSKGGMTLSGGEPLMQGEFAIALLKEAKKRYLNTAIETTGYVPWEVLKEAGQYLDHVFYDLKCMNEEKHISYTKASNQLIKANFIRLCNEFKNLSITVRTPVIPGFNDSEEEIGNIIDFLEPYPRVCYELLPYHAFGENKYRNLGREYLLKDGKLDSKVFDQLKELVNERVGRRM